MSSSDRINALLDMLAQYKAGGMHNELVIDAKERLMMPKALNNPLPRGRQPSKSNQRVALMNRVKELVSTRTPNPPPKPYEPRARMYSSFPLLKKPDFVRNYKDTDARLQGNTEDCKISRKSSSIAPIRALSKNLSPPRTHSLRSHENDSYKDITVADIDNYGMYEMTLRGDIPKDADLGPVFFRHPGDVQPTLIAKVLETREKVESATRPRIRDDVPRHFSTLKFDMDFLDHELQQLMSPEDYDVSFSTYTSAGHKPAGVSDAMPDVERNGQDAPLVKIADTDSLRPSPQHIERPLLFPSSSIFNMGGSLKADHIKVFNTASQIVNLKQLSKAASSIKAFTSTKKYSYMLSHEFVYDFHIPVNRGTILTNTSVYQAMMVQYAFISSYIGFIIDRLQRLFNYVPPFNGHINGNSVISLALSSYFKPFIDLSTVADHVYYGLVLSDYFEQTVPIPVVNGPDKEETAALTIQTAYRVLHAHREVEFLRQSRKAALCIQTYARQHLAIVKTEALYAENRTNMHLQLSKLRETLVTQLDSALEDLARHSTDSILTQNQKIRDFMVLEVSFWKKLFRSGYTPTKYIYCIIISSRPCYLCDQRRIMKLTNSTSISVSRNSIFLRHDLYSTSVADYSLLVDPRMFILALCDGEYTDSSNMSLLLQQLYRDALPISKIDVNRIKFLDDEELIEAIREHRQLTENTNLLLDLQFGKVKKVFKQVIEKVITQTNGSTESLVFYLPYAHQQFDKNYEALSYETNIPIFGSITRDALYYTDVQTKLKNDQKFLSLSSSSIDRSRTRGPARVASFGVAPTHDLQEGEVKAPATWSRVAASAIGVLKYPAVILRPDMMCYFPGCDILSDSLGGFACGMSEFNKADYKSTKTNIELTSDITLSFPFKKANEKDLSRLYLITKAVFQAIPERNNVLQYITFALYVDRDTQYSVISSYAEIPSYSYFPVGKIMSACYVAPAFNEVEIFTTAVGLFASSIAAAYKYTGYMTLSFIMTTGYKQGTDRGTICPRLIFNGVTYGLTTRILTTLYRTLLESTRYEYNLFMTSLGNRFINEQNMFALIQLILNNQNTACALQRTSTELNVVIGGWNLEDIFIAGNAVLSIIQRESNCEEAILSILKEKKDNQYSQERFEELGSSPFYVCGLNNIIHGSSDSAKRTS